MAEMKIGIDARMALRKCRGMSRVLLNLLNHLVLSGSKNQYTLYLEKSDTECILPTVVTSQKGFFLLENTRFGNRLACRLLTRGGNGKLKCTFKEKQFFTIV